MILQMLDAKPAVNPQGNNSALREYGMENKIEFLDHKNKNAKLTSIILVAASFFSLAIFIPVCFMLASEDGIDPIFLFVFVPVFFSFSLLPLLIIRFTVGKNKKTVFDLDKNKIQFHEGKKIVSELNFSEIQSLNQSRYTYTVKTKNGSRTVTVYTIVSLTHPQQILAESSDFFQARSFAETIAKILKIPLTNEKGEKRELSELDLPFHRRPHPEFDSFSIPNFSKETDLNWKDTGTEFQIVSHYNPPLFRILGFLLSFVLFLILNLALGDALGIGIFSWENFPPTLAEGLFFLIVTSISLVPVTFAFYNGYKSKIIRIANEGIHKNRDFISFDSLEEILLEDNHLILLSDQKILKIAMYLFCKNEDYNTVKEAIVYGILTKTNGGASSSFTQFTTEF